MMAGIMVVHDVMKAIPAIMSDVLALMTGIHARQEFGMEASRLHRYRDIRRPEHQCYLDMARSQVSQILGMGRDTAEHHKCGKGNAHDATPSFRQRSACLFAGQGSELLLRECSASAAMPEMMSEFRTHWKYLLPCAALRQTFREEASETPSLM